MVRSSAVLVCLLCVWLMFYLLLQFIDPLNHGNRSTNTTMVKISQKLDLPLYLKVQRDDTCSQVELNATHNKEIKAICEKIKKDENVFYNVRTEKVNKFNHSFLIPNPYMCDIDTEIIILIHSLHDYLGRRAAIRDTWGGAANKGTWINNTSLPSKIKVAFILGLHTNNDQNIKLKQEASEYGDIIQADFYESYNNMTLKSLSGLKWVTEHCPGAKTLIKSDDDMIINIPHLLAVIAQTNATKFIMGPYNHNARVMRRGKWKISFSDFPFYYFPPYESGAAYVISNDLVPLLLQASDYVPRIFIDDVYITGILAKIIGAKHIYVQGFAYWISKRPSECDILKNKIITGTKMNPGSLRTLWENLKRHNNCDDNV